MNSIILVRHAHRDKPAEGKLDNGLSEKGRRQAEDLALEIRKLIPDEQPPLFSSPARRCIETLEPFAKIFEREIEPSKCLEEMDDSDSVDDFRDRIEGFLEEQTENTVLACTHGDWIEECLVILFQKPMSLPKGVSAAWIELKESGPVLRSLIWSDA